MGDEDGKPHDSDDEAGREKCLVRPLRTVDEAKAAAIETLKCYLQEVDQLQKQYSAGDRGYAAIVELTEHRRKSLLHCANFIGLEQAARVRSNSFGKSLLHCFVMAADKEASETVCDVMRCVRNSKGRMAEESFQVAWDLGGFRDERGIAFNEWLQKKR